MKKLLKNKYLPIFLVLAAGLSLLINYKIQKYRIDQELAYNKKLKSKFQNKFNAVFEKRLNKFPTELNFENQQLTINYTINEQLNSYIKKLLKRYKSDYSSVVVIDNNDGSVLSAVGYDRKSNDFSYQLPFSSSHPSASLFKIVTVADLIENQSLDPNDLFTYKGRGTTLYKYQLRKYKNKKWTRTQTLNKAFAYSNNVIFGKAAIYNSNGNSLFKMAQQFGFNKKIMRDIDISKSYITFPEDQYNLAEIASGFNKDTLISPIHAALLSSIVVNNGTMKMPRIVRSIKDEQGNSLWVPERIERKVMSLETSKQMQNMMENVVSKGTARGGFRRMSRLLKSKLLIGGKTGSITGGVPFGKRDWFTAYATPSDTSDLGISISVMNVNIKKWRVKSTYLARKIIEHYYKNLLPGKLGYKKSKKEDNGV